MTPLALGAQRRHAVVMSNGALESKFAVSAAERWEEDRRAYMDPEGAFEELYGREAIDLEKVFRSYGAPFRDYTQGGPEWLRSIGAK